MLRPVIMTSVYIVCTKAYLLLNSKFLSLSLFFLKIFFLNLDPETITISQQKEAVQVILGGPQDPNHWFLMAQVVPTCKCIIKVRKMSWWQKRKQRGLGSKAL